MNSLVKRENFSIMDTAACDHLWNTSERLAQSNIVPAIYRGNPGNIYIALMRSVSMNVDPQFFMEQSYVISGKLGIQAKFLIALINSSGRVKDQLQWKFEEKQGKILSCECFAVLTTNKTTVNYILTREDVINNGWYNKENTPWKKNPRKMFMYRTAAWLADLYFPDIVGGMSTIEALNDEQGEIQKQTVETEAEVVEDNEIKLSLFEDPIQQLKDKIVSKIPEKEFFAEFLQEMGYLGAGETDFDKMNHKQVENVFNNFKKIRSEFDEKVRLHCQCIDFCTTISQQEQRDFSNWLSKSSLKGVWGLKDLKLRELRNIVPNWQELYEKFQKTFKKDTKQT